MADAKGCNRCNDENMMIKLGDSTECPVCLSPILDPPVYMCARSHIFCEDCHITLKKDNQDCPVCKGELAGNKNIPVERMLDSLPKTQCKNEGCSFKKVDPKKVESHGDVCQYRLINCLKCRKDVSLIDMSGHQLNEHKGKKEEDVKFGTDYSGWTCPLSFSGGWSQILKIEQEGNNQVFFLNILVHDNGRHLCWISQSQSKKDIQKYKYTISILCGKAYDDGKKIKRLLTYSGFCVPVDLDAETIKNGSPCISISKVFLKEIQDKKENYVFEWRIDILE